MPELTPEQQQDIQNRAEAFMKDYADLVKKYEIKMTAVPVYAPTDNGIYITMIQGGPVDTKYESVKSNFMKSE